MPFPSLRSLFGQLLRGLVDLVYPGACWVCGRFEPSLREPVCAVCRPQLTTDPFPTCPRCSSTVGPHVVLDNGCSQCREENFAFDQALRLAPYEGLLREVILRLKQSGGEGLAEAVAPSWCAVMLPRLQPHRPDLVVPVPAHWTRYWRRTYNPPDVLAHALARRMGLPCVPGLLRRRRRTVRLATLAPSARPLAVKDAFAPGYLADLTGQTILLVDDVLTTGATAHEAARVLKKMKAARVIVAVMAHGR